MALLHLELLLLFGCFLQANALQPGRGVQYKDHVDPFPAKDRLDCDDQMKTPGRCVIEKARRGCQSQLMQKYCARTCHFCHKKAPAPPKVVDDCKETTYGCCWDGTTTQRSYDREGCPPCEDNRVFAALCGIWEKHCRNTSNPIEHNVVKLNCHRTCSNCFIPKSTERTKVTKTLPPAIGHFANSDDSPRRGAIYVWTKLVNPFGFATFDRQ